MKNSKNEQATTHTVPGQPILFLISIKISTSDNITLEDTGKEFENLSLPQSLSDFWCSLSGNTVTFNYAGYDGKNYGAVLFDVLYI